LAEVKPANLSKFAPTRSIRARWIIKKIKDQLYSNVNEGERIENGKSRGKRKDPEHKEAGENGSETGRT